MVDVQSSHGAHVLVTLSNDHVTPSSHDLSRVVKDDVSVLASCDEDSRWVTAVIHSMRAPDQFVVSVGGSWVMSSSTETRKTTGCMLSVSCFFIPVGRGEGATRLHFQTWFRKV